MSPRQLPYTRCAEGTVRVPVRRFLVQAFLGSCGAGAGGGPMCSSIRWRWEARFGKAGIHREPKGKYRSGVGLAARCMRHNAPLRVVLRGSYRMVCISFRQFVCISLLCSDKIIFPCFVQPKRICIAGHLDRPEASGKAQPHLPW